MDFTFLHISDLHYRLGRAEENGLVLQKFIEDIANQAKTYEKPFLIFSGDVVLAGEDAKLYKDFDEKIATALETAGFPKSRRICIPGNHDISRSVLKPLLQIQNGALSAMKEEASFNNNLAQLTETFFRPKFENYQQFERNFAKYTCCETAIGGSGWELARETGVYCLNTALCSSAGLEDPVTGERMSDRGFLMIDTRSLHHWLTTFPFKNRIMVMHHPIDWLADWSKLELERIIANNFQLVVCGHVHQNSARYASYGVRSSVECIAPPLFTRKSEALGYAFISVSGTEPTVRVIYRQWSPKQTFVPGTVLAGSETGELLFNTREIPLMVNDPDSDGARTHDTVSILQAEFDEASTCYSSKRKLWVDRDLSPISETDAQSANTVLTTQYDLIGNLRSCIIRAPKQFGLTCLGRFIALEHFRQCKNGQVIAMFDISQMEHFKQGTIKSVRARCDVLGIAPTQLAAIILDNWQGDKRSRGIVHHLKEEYQNIPIIILHNVEDGSQIAEAMEADNDVSGETLYLWALTRARIRELVVKYVVGCDNLEDDIVTKRITEDIDALNIYRTPLNCLLLLKLTEQAFDDSPVNRTEVIGRVLYLLFYQFNKIPRYATRPDLKDCEYALGFFCEWLLRSAKNSFTKDEFYLKVHEYCIAKMVTLDIEVLFSFLASENIFVRKGFYFEFRFTYWLYFFAAHRMHHQPEFAKFILEDDRYAAFPEIIEFYTGIDRRRCDAVLKLTEDMSRKNSEFLSRIGIVAEYNPFRRAVWNSTEIQRDELKRELRKDIAESSLPSIVKDNIADQSYDRSKPYNQALARFIKESTLSQMISAMRGAARALRNSDHVSPDAKTALLQEVITCWVRISQLLVLLSPILATLRSVTFEDICFVLADDFDEKTVVERWETLISAIVDNVVSWYQEDLFSKRMGPLLFNFVRANAGTMGELLVMLLTVKQRPPGWEKEIEAFIVREQKNSFYMSKVFAELRSQLRIGFASERARHELRRLAAMSLAKHSTGAKHPNIALVEKAVKVLERAIDESPKNMAGDRAGK